VDRVEEIGEKTGVKKGKHTLFQSSREKKKFVFSAPRMTGKSCDSGKGGEGEKKDQGLVTQKVEKRRKIYRSLRLLGKDRFRLPAKKKGCLLFNPGARHKSIWKTKGRGKKIAFAVTWGRFERREKATRGGIANVRRD